MNLDTPVPIGVTQNEKDALAGTSGTPSASNKYVTNEDARVLTDWFSVHFDPNANYSNYRTRSLGTSAAHRITIPIPPDFGSWVSCKAELIPVGTGTGLDIDLSTEYSKQGEDYQLQTESDTTSTYDFTTDQKASIDLTGVLTGVEAGDSVGLLIDHKSIGMTCHYLHILGVYNKA